VANEHDGATKWTSILARIVIFQPLHYLLPIYLSSNASQSHQRTGGAGHYPFSPELKVANFALLLSVR